MLTAQRRRWLVPLTLGLLVLLGDQASKIWIRSTLGPEPLRQRITLLVDWIHLVYSRNTGVAFGLFQNMSPLFTFTSLLICLGAVYVYITYLPNDRWPVQISMGLILGGAVGNIIDRVRLGYVVDFIEVGWWPIFNVADSAITTGATVLALFLLFTPEEPPPRRNPQDDALLGELLNQDIEARPHQPAANGQPTGADETAQTEQAERGTGNREAAG